MDVIEDWRPTEVASLESDLEDLARIMHAIVHEGHGLTFLAPFTVQESRAFWTDKVVPGLNAGTRRMLVARRNGRIVGTVQLDMNTPPNQSHRAEVAKLLVDPAARRGGIARSLMQALETLARSEGRTLLSLDTWTGSHAEKLYESLGFTTLGIIPNFATTSTARTLEPATIMFKQL